MIRPFVVLILSFFFALSAESVESQTHFVIRVQSQTETVQQICDRLGLELVGSLDRPKFSKGRSSGWGAKYLKRWLHSSTSGVYLVKTPDYFSTGSMIELLQSEEGIEAVEVDRRRYLFKALTERQEGYFGWAPPGGSNDTIVVERLTDRTPADYFGSSVWMGYVKQPATELTRLADTHADLATGSGIVAVIDTGVDPNHSVLKHHLTQGFDFVKDHPGKASEWWDLDKKTSRALRQSTVAVLDQSTVAVLDQSTVAVLNEAAAEALRAPEYAAFGHGTMVAGIIHLVAPTAKIMPLKVFRSDGTANNSDIVRAIYYAVENGANVINMSFSFSEYSSELLLAVNYATRNGVICVSSVGNEGVETLVYPALFANVLGVAATTDQDTRSELSNFGENIVAMAAPGEGIVTTYPGGTYAAVYGTSFSAALVSGGAALLLDIDADTNPYLAMKALSHAKKLSEELGHGRVDFYEALLSAVSTPPK